MTSQCNCQILTHNHNLHHHHALQLSDTAGLQTRAGHRQLSAVRMIAVCGDTCNWTDTSSRSTTCCRYVRVSCAIQCTATSNWTTYTHVHIHTRRRSFVFFTHRVQILLPHLVKPTAIVHVYQRFSTFLYPWATFATGLQVMGRKVKNSEFKKSKMNILW